MLFSPFCKGTYKRVGNPIEKIVEKLKNMLKNIIIICGNMVK